MPLEPFPRALLCGFCQQFICVTVPTPCSTFQNAGPWCLKFGGLKVHGGFFKVRFHPRKGFSCVTPRYAQTEKARTLCLYEQANTRDQGPVYLHNSWKEEIPIEKHLSLRRVLLVLLVLLFLLFLLQFLHPQTPPSSTRLLRLASPRISSSVCSTHTIVLRNSAMQRNVMQCILLTCRVLELSLV